MDNNRRDAFIENHLIPTRRHLLQNAGGLIAASALPANRAVGATLPPQRLRNQLRPLLPISPVGLQIIW